MGDVRLHARKSDGPVEETAASHHPAPVQVANRVLAAAVQPKLEVGPAGDRYEAEADRVARAVVGAAGRAQRQGAGPEEEELQMNRVQRLGSAGGGLEEEELQMSRIRRIAAPVVGAAGGELDRATESAISRAAAGGRPLDAGVQREMGSSMGADFSGVRVHTGPKVDALNGSLQARAFTTGSNVFVRSGDYRPDTRGGKELLAHELTHVVQQGAAPTLPDQER